MLAGENRKTSQSVATKLWDTWNNDGLLIKHRAGLPRLDLIKTRLIIVKKIIVFGTKYFITRSDNLDDKI